MSDPADIDALRDVARRYVWLLSELHGGNQFSKDQLWRWLEEADAALLGAEADVTPSAI